MRVNEIFGPTIQGEGKTQGIECIFIRLVGCSLHCIWCDSSYTWNWKGTKFKHPDKYDKKKEIHEMSISEIISKVRKLNGIVKSIVITGGEPLIQQNELIDLIRQLKDYNYRIEIETNGTIMPVNNLLEIVDQVNCSPKLQNNGEDDIKVRIKPKILKKFVLSDKTNFKFVVINENDLMEIVQLVKKYKMKDIWLMTEGKTKEEQLQRQESIKELANHYGFNFTSRIQVLKWGDKREI